MSYAPTTNWSVVKNAGFKEPEAVRVLIESYRPVIVSYFTMQLRTNKQQAEDLTQQFIMDKFLIGRFLELSDKKKGRFRVYLQTAIKYFLIDQYRKDRKMKTVSLVTENFECDGSSSGRTKDPFDIIWAKNILNQSVTLYQAKCKRDQRPDLWIIINALIFRPLLYGDEVASREELTSQLNLRSVRHLNNLLATAKSQFSVIVSNEVAKTLDLHSDVEDEVDFLINALSGE